MKHKTHHVENGILKILNVCQVQHKEQRLAKEVLHSIIVKEQALSLPASQTQKIHFDCRLVI